MLRIFFERVAELEIHQITKKESASGPYIWEVGGNPVVSPLLLIAVPYDVVWTWIPMVQS
jgi:hypothetical protein